MKSGLTFDEIDCNRLYDAICERLANPHLDESIPEEREELAAFKKLKERLEEFLCG